MPKGSAAVVSNFYACLLGGPLSQLLKCLTAVKVCAEFEKQGVYAVPVCLARQDAPRGFSTREINFIDRASKLHCLKPYEMETNDAGSVIDGRGNEKLFAEIEKIFPDAETEPLSALKEAFIPNTNSVSSCARWLKYLLNEFGVHVIEVAPEQASGNSDFQCLPQNLMFPVAAFVADSSEIAEYAKESALCESEGMPRPLVRPLTYATISNARSLKTLRRYGLDLTRIFDGKERVLDYVRKTLESDVPDRLQKLRNESAAVLDELEPAAFAARGERSVRIRKARAARIIYQLEKLQKHSCAAVADKEKAAENRIRKACDFLAPFGRRQQDTFGGAQIPLFYGRTGLRAIYERLDITTQDHQLIEMD